MRIHGFILALWVVGCLAAEQHEPPAIPAELPRDDPYLSSTDWIPPGIRPDPLHHLDAIRATWWEIPDNLRELHPGGPPAQRVIYRDTLTGATVWLISRGPGSEFCGFYSTRNNFNANGSLLEIDRFLMRVDGSDARPLDSLVDRSEDHSAVQNFAWDPRDPDRGLVRRFSGRMLRLNLRTREETSVFEPGDDIPRTAALIYSYDGTFSLVYSGQGSSPPFLHVGDAKGNLLREVRLASASPDPAQDYMGGLRLYQDREDRYWVVYSLNKAATVARTDNPHQVWMVALEGGTVLEYTGAPDSAFAGKREELRLAGRNPLTPSMGHAGLSPSERYVISRRGAFISIQDLEQQETRALSYVPSADHFDWSAAVDWFLTRTRSQPGLPIYRIEVPSGVAHRIVASNTSDHLAAFSYSHPSPDGTKALYRSAMLGKNDMYMAVVQYPLPPRDVALRRQDDGILLTWRPPEYAREIKGYRVYRSARSGGPYEPLGAGLVTATHFLDQEPLEPAYYVLTSIEHSGLESRSFSTEAAASWPGHVRIFFEAESAAFSFPMRRVFIPDTASAAYALARAARDPLWQTAEGAGVAEWRVELPKDGDYYLWVRARSLPGYSANMTFTVAEGDSHAWREPLDGWQWVSLAGPLPLRSGPQAVMCAMPAPGYELDKLLLTTDPGDVPRAMGNTPADPPESPTALQASLDATGRHVLLEWRHTPGPLFQHYQVYKGHSAGFEPGQRNLLGSPVAPAFMDPQPADTGPIFYRVLAVDVWGNRSQISASAAVTMPARPPPARQWVRLDTQHARGALRFVEDSEAAGGKYALLDDTSGDGIIEIPLDLPPGRYLVWARVRSKGRYQSVRLDVAVGSREMRGSITGAARGLFSDFMWAWRRVQVRSRTEVPRLAPLWVEAGAAQEPLTLRYRDGYMEMDQILLTSCPHDLPAPDAAWFKPEDAYRFTRP